MPAERRELTRFAVPLAIGGAAFALRFIGLSWGLPFDLHPDEPVILEIVERMGAGTTLNPGFFVYPGFFIYQVFALGRAVAALGGGYPQLLYAARLLTAAYSLATVGFVYLLGARLGGRLLGAVAALLTATMGALTLQAHYAVTDTPATALATATLWIALRAYQRGSRAELLAAAALAGLAVSTKYSVAPVCVAPWIGAMALAHPAGASWTRRAATTALLAAVAVGAFLITSPYTVLDHRAFLRDIRTEARLQAEARAGEHVAALQNPGLADRGLVGNAQVAYRDMGPAELLLALAMVGVILAGGPRAARAASPAEPGRSDAQREGGPPGPRATVDRVGGVMLVAWVLLYFAALAPSTKFGQRYALPMYPALLVLAAVPIAGLLRRERSTASSASWLLG
ncbi:MAG: glycosyltransferase family 39 protein, partial [Acidobacteriota bacterium]